jgi:hypothetical protein
MNPSPAISYELARSRIADLRHQARRESLAQAALAQRAALAHGARTPQTAQPRKPPVPSRLRLRLRLRSA